MSRRFLRALAARIATLAVAAGMVATAFGAVALLHWRAEGPAAAVPADPEPMPVAAVTADRRDGYTVTERYTGRLEPARTVRPAAERSGLVVEMRVDEGDRVAAGQALARLDTRLLEAERDRLVAALERVGAELELARITADRQRRLEAQGHSSTQRYDEARLSVDSLTAERDSTAAALRAVEVDLDKSTIRAPFDGTVAQRAVDEGTVVAAGTTLVTVLESGRPEARIGVAPDAVRALAAGATFTLSADGRDLAARLRATRPDIETGTRTVPLLFSVTDHDPPAFGAVVDLAVERWVPADGFAVPLTALVEGERGLWTVYVAEADESGARRVVRESVEIVHLDDETAFVRGTLADGAAVVVGGPQRVAPGQAVTLAGAPGPGSRREAAR